MGSAAVLLVPGLAAAVLVKLGDGGFRHSIHRSATELLYLPVFRPELDYVVLQAREMEGLAQVALMGAEALYDDDPRAEAVTWFRSAKFDLFMHYGLYSLLGRGEWVSETVPGC